MNKGLTVVLDAHTDILGSSSIDVDNQGFIGTVTSSASFPLTFQDGFQISPGYTTMVIKTYLVTLEFKTKYNFLT